MASYPNLEHFSTSTRRIQLFLSNLSAIFGAIHVFFPFVVRQIFFPGFFLLCFCILFGGIICWWPRSFLTSWASSSHFSFCSPLHGSLLPCCFLFNGWLTTLNIWSRNHTKIVRPLLKLEFVINFILLWFCWYYKCSWVVRYYINLLKVIFES